MRWIWIAVSGCASGADTGESGAECTRPCIESPYHQCGAYRAASESLSCTALGVGVRIDDWTAYSVTSEAGALVELLRDGETLSGDCAGSVIIDRWTVDPEAEGCSLVEAVPQTCGALEAGIFWDTDVTGWSVEAITSEGGVLIPGAYTTQNRLFATCPEGVEMARVVSVLPDLSQVGIDEPW